MNIANKLTIFRALLIPIFLVFLLYQSIPYSSILCLVIFVVASLTDFVDGHIARKYNMISDFGKFADPLADKLLVCAALIGFCYLGKLNPWFAFIIISREFIVTGLRIVAISSGTVIAAGMSGKLKTVFQLFAVIFMIFDRIYTISFAGISLSWVLMLIAVILTLYSGAEYVLKNWQIIDYNK